MGFILYTVDDYLLSIPSNSLSQEKWLASEICFCRVIFNHCYHNDASLLSFNSLEIQNIDQELHICYLMKFDVRGDKENQSKNVLSMVTTKSVLKS